MIVKGLVVSQVTFLKFSQLFVTRILLSYNDHPWQHSETWLFIFNSIVAFQLYFWCQLILQVSTPTQRQTGLNPEWNIHQIVNCDTKLWRCWLKWTFAPGTNSVEWVTINQCIRVIACCPGFSSILVWPCAFALLTLFHVKGHICPYPERCPSSSQLPVGEWGFLKVTQ